MKSSHRKHCARHYYLTNDSKNQSLQSKNKLIRFPEFLKYNEIDSPVDFVSIVKPSSNRMQIVWRLQSLEKPKENDCNNPIDSISIETYNFIM